MPTKAEAGVIVRKKRTLSDREKKKRVVKPEEEEETKTPREIKTVQKKREPDEYDYDSSDEEVKLFSCVFFNSVQRFPTVFETFPRPSSQSTAH